MNIWIVEDDNLQLELLASKLQKEIPNVELTPINTEYEFCQRMASLTLPYPNLVILDIMLRWTDPSPDMQQPPDDVKEEGYYRAGFRCERLIREHPVIKDIPVFMYTVLDEFDITENMQLIDNNKTRYVGKNADDGLLSSIKILFCSHRK